MVLKQMRNEAIDMLVLWAASKEYSAVSARHGLPPSVPAGYMVKSHQACLTVLQEIEAVLKHWASTFEIPDIELNNRLVAAANGELSRPCSASANVSTRPQGSLTAAAVCPCCTQSLLTTMPVARHATQGCPGCLVLTVLS